MKALFTAILLAFQACLMAQLPTVFEQSQGRESADYQTCIAFYQELDRRYPAAKLLQYGMTDAGKPLHLFVIDFKQNFKSRKLEARDYPVILINNAIHAGEPCGVDASLMLARDILEGKLEYPEDVVLAIIPMYNIGGALNRGCCTRANQSGPEAYGFRGNSRYLDLNRDFIKMDSRNSFAFAEIFRSWDPDIFLDTHTTNGADYPYTMTLITTQSDKVHPSIKNILSKELEPFLYKGFDDSPYLLAPYVNSISNVPDSGLVEFADHPRYSSGYTALFQTLSLISEAHMLKSFEDRVKATYLMEKLLISFADEYAALILSARKFARKEETKQRVFTLNYKVDLSDPEAFEFKGYKACIRKSQITGTDRLYYDCDQPWEKAIPFYRKYLPVDSVSMPLAYIIPFAWREVIERLYANQVEMFSLADDVLLQVECNRIVDFHSFGNPWEGHFYHDSIAVARTKRWVQFYENDILIYCNQEANRFLSQVLEPSAPDSYVRWNYFDAVVQRKEYFSAYVFEETADSLLKNDPEIRARFEEKKLKDEAFRNDPAAQLWFLYESSPFAEKNLGVIPVYRLEQPAGILLRPYKPEY